MVMENSRQGIDSRLAQPMVWLIDRVLRCPGMTIAVAVLFAAIGIYLSVTKLSYRTSRLDLLNPSHCLNRKFKWNFSGRFCVSPLR